MLSRARNVITADLCPLSALPEGGRENQGEQTTIPPKHQKTNILFTECMLNPFSTPDFPPPLLAMVSIVSESKRNNTENITF